MGVSKAAAVTAVPLACILKQEGRRPECLRLHIWSVPTAVPTLDSILHAVLQQKGGVDPQRGGAEGADDHRRQQRDDARRARHQRVADHERAERHGRAPQQVVRPEGGTRIFSHDTDGPEMA